MKRYVILAYGLACYAIFLATFVYAVWFVSRMDVTPREPARPLAIRILADAGLLIFFSLQHSVMARQWFKRAWTRIVPEAAERSTYILFASVALLIVFRFWQPLPASIWKVENHAGALILRGVSALGWLLVLVSTFLIDHFELFGLRQAWSNFTGAPLVYKGFVTPGPYKLVRHPLYLGFIVAFWSTPTMTAGHLLFAILTTVYILVAIQLEERDLKAILGEPYRSYQQSVSMLTPLPRKSRV